MSGLQKSDVMVGWTASLEGVVGLDKKLSAWAVLTLELPFAVSPASNSTIGNTTSSG